MIENIKPECPVCGNIRDNASSDELMCKKCGFEYAFVKMFAGRHSRQIWSEIVNEKKTKLRKKNLSELIGKRNLFLGRNSVAYMLPETNRLALIDGSGKILFHEDVAFYDSSERNSLIVYKNGKIKVTGDNSYNQCDTDKLTDISHAICAPNCTYAVKKDGSVVSVGLCTDKNIKNWKNISCLASGTYHLLALSKNGNVTISGEMIEKSVIDKILSWKNVKAIAAADDLSLALFNDGTVSFAGRENDPRSEAENWTNIADIAADSSYAVGLTNDGNILLAGKCKAYLDMGRSAAREWKNISAVSCSRSGICAVDCNGKLYMVGNFIGDIPKVEKVWNDEISAKCI